MEEKYFTAGQIAKLAGVSLRTIRFYDAKGLLKPVSYSEAGYRYYDRNSIITLQRILMWKYLGFSLEQIEKMMREESKTEDNTDMWLFGQKELLLQKKKQLEEMIETIEIMEKAGEKERWDYLIRFLNLLTDDERIKIQYENSQNLEKRINIHALYSTSKQDWTDWVFERLKLKPGDTVLELGCGNGQLWGKNVYRLPEKLHLILTDRSEGMLDQARQNLSGYEDVLKEQSICIEYRVADANELQLPEAYFDCIIANHMLYHVEKREECLRAISKALKPKGTFFCSTVGDEHMREMHRLVREFDERIELSRDRMTGGFRLENGGQQLEKFFAEVVREDQENDLIVDSAEAIYDYVASYPGNAAYILEKRRDEFLGRVQEIIDREGSFFIHKSTGMFRCKK